ncbi:MAG: NADH-quinone oxidoreductase subunit [Clostridia bacterium]|nr:NADH-quinone oxidoreductase subunit [Clostridia bacterium]
MSYQIIDNCIACGNCMVACPQKAIIENSTNSIISNTSGGFFCITDACNECGTCQEVCPYQAIIWVE